MVFDAESTGNRRQSLADCLRKDIQEKALPAGTQLRPIRELARSHGVSYAFMRRVLLLLQEQGVVELRHGSGVYVAAEDAPPAPAPVSSPSGHGKGASAAKRLLVLTPHWASNHGFSVVQRIMNGLAEAARIHRWRLEVLPVILYRELQEHFFEEILWREPGGIAWVRPLIEYEVMAIRLKDRGFTQCSCGRRYLNTSLPCFSYSLESMADQTMAWARANGRDRVVILGNLMTPQFCDDYAAAACAALDKAARRHSVPLLAADVYDQVAPTTQRSAEAAEDFILKRKDADMFICLFQSYIKVLEKAVRGGAFANPDQVAVVDYNQHYIPDLPLDLGGMKYLRAEFDPALEGLAMARFFERRWADAKLDPPPEIPVVLREANIGTRTLA